jgi:hypothetical protein
MPGQDQLFDIFTILLYFMGRRMRRESHVSRGRGWNHHNKHLLEFDKRINKGTRVKFCLRIPQEGLLADAPCRYYYTFRDGYGQM